MRKLIAALTARFRAAPDPYRTAYDTRRRLHAAGLDSAQVASVISAAARDGRHDTAGLTVAYRAGRGFTVSDSRPGTAGA